MRKGADCLSKWVGEAERQLRTLFEQAKQYQPSIIFFDEIDGLAPVRSSKQVFASPSSSLIRTKSIPLLSLRCLLWWMVSILEDRSSSLVQPIALTLLILPYEDPDDLTENYTSNCLLSPVVVVSLISTQRTGTLHFLSNSRTSWRVGPMAMEAVISKDSAMRPFSVLSDELILKYCSLFDSIV